MRVYPVVKTLPASYVSAIGRVMIRWAHLEWVIKQITYQILGIGPKAGRLAIKEGRIDEQLSVIENLLRLKGIPLGPELGKFKNELEAVKKERDRLAHGIWVRDPTTKQLFIQETRGNWQPDPAKNEKWPRKIHPEGVPLTPANIAHTRRQIEKATRIMLDFEKNVRARMAALNVK